uniref:Uncharacterized protein n=1 Tax=Panagrolaimus superbus TaxID=310955 RepID=A0A914YJV8_9BILA
MFFLQETTADTERQLSQRRQQPEYPTTQASKIDEVDELIKTMEWKMRTGTTNGLFYLYRNFEDLIKIDKIY